MPKTPESGKHNNSDPKNVPRRTGLQRQNDKDMPVKAIPWERAQGPELAKKSPLHPELKDSNYGHNRGATFEIEAGNRAYHAEDAKMGDEPTIEGPATSNIIDPAKV